MHSGAEKEEAILADANVGYAIDLRDGDWRHGLIPRGAREVKGFLAGATVG